MQDWRCVLVSVQVKPTSCPRRTGGSCWWAACWRCVTCSATRRPSWWWSPPWSSTPSTTTSPGGRRWSSSACPPPSSTATTTMPTTTSGRLERLRRAASLFVCCVSLNLPLCVCFFSTDWCWWKKWICLSFGTFSTRCADVFVLH